MTADLEANPELSRARAVRLASLADEVASVAATVAGSSFGSAPTGVDHRWDALAAALGRQAVNLALVAAEEQRAAQAVADQESAVLGELSSLERDRRAVSSSLVTRVLG